MLKQQLIANGIVKVKRPGEEPFTLKSGKKSRLFIDIKQASLDPFILKKIIKKIIKIMLIYSSYSGYSKIASVAIGGVPIATLLSLETGLSQIIIRSEKHDRGTQSKIIGDCKGKSCILIEDVATTGGSIINAVKAIREAGGYCNDCIVVVDREEGAKENCAKENIKLLPLFKKSDFGITEEFK